MGFHQFEQPIFLSNNLITAYSSLGQLQTSRKVFDEMPERNTVSYNSMITAYIRNEEGNGAWDLFVKMMGSGIIPTQYTFGSLFSSLSLELVQGFQLHSLILKNGLLYSNAYSGCLDEVMKLFEEMPYKNLETVNSIISSFGHYGFVEESMIMYIELLRASVSPSECSFVGVLSGFEGLRYLDASKQIHGMVLKTGSEFYTSVSNSLINMDIVSWNTVIGAFAKSFDPGKALELFLTMPLHGFTQNQATFASVISSCSSLHILKCGELIHAKAIKININSDIIVGSALIDFYSKCNCLEQGDVVFIELRTKNVISWNALIAGYSNKDFRASFSLFQQMLHEDYRPNEFTFSAVLKLSMTQNLQQLHCLILKMACTRCGEYREVLELFKSMQLARVSPDNCTVVSLLSISTKLFNLELGSNIHGLMIRTDFSRCDVFVCNVLVDMYSKCGSIESSVKVFNEMTHRNLISWIAVISGLGLHGYPSMALEIFREMELLGFKPDGVAFIAVLSACRHGGLVEDGMELFGRMKRCYNIEPEMDYYVCLVDMLTRYGHLKEAEQLISAMPLQPNAAVWRTFVEGCRRYNSIQEAVR
ncbi:hypothetical protein AQUCO_00300430v1 [Aquilegia coerulea]|uniref:Pentatricopeptide repeat-containing protein n=1 Tax=Aquilegia coerulea TaxID=218851 RepID=A0A2G5EYU6_AQUCA|nr:hypothetical protein AQUCO_00300430v1 [Aquilegia coerulea]